MKFLTLAILSFSTLLSDMLPPVGGQKSFRFDKVQFNNHFYVVISENVFGAQSHVEHDPDCPCMRRLTEEQIAKIIREVIKLKENQKCTP